MVFKGRFFSSKKSDSSSPDASSNNSPRSFNSNSPSRSDKKKSKSAANQTLTAAAAGGGGGGSSGGLVVKTSLLVKTSSATVSHRRYPYSHHHSSWPSLHCETLGSAPTVLAPPHCSFCTNVKITSRHQCSSSPAQSPRTKAAKASSSGANGLAKPSSSHATTVRTTVRTTTPPLPRTHKRVAAEQRRNNVKELDTIRRSKVYFLCLVLSIRKITFAFVP